MKFRRCAPARRPPTFRVALALAMLATLAATSTLQGQIFVGSASSIIQLNASGTGTSFASGGGLNTVRGLAFDSAGNVYAANLFGNTIEKFTPDGVGAIFATSANGLNLPEYLTIDSAGNLYVGNYSSNNVLVFTPDGVGSVYASENINGAYGVAFDAAGNLFVSNFNDGRIIQITPGGVSTVFATAGTNPAGIAFDSAGNLFVANYNSNNVMKFTPGGLGSVFATTLLNQPISLAFDSSGDLFVANNGGGIIRFAPDGTGSLFAIVGPSAEVIATPFVAVPEMSTFASLSVGVVALGIIAWHRRRAS